MAFVFLVFVQFMVEIFFVMQFMDHLTKTKFNGFRIYYSPVSKLLKKTVSKSLEIYEIV